MSDNTKPGRYIHFLPGGGLGDVFREAYFYNGLGILKRWKLDHPRDHLRVLLMTHNPSSADLLVGQSWIDEVVTRRFPVEKTWQWEAVYDYYAQDFDGHEELRISLYDHRTLYDSHKNRLRKKLVPVRQIEPVGTAWDLYLEPFLERMIVGRVDGYVVFHPFAGSADRSLATYPDLREAVEDALRAADVKFITVGGNYERPAYQQIPAHAAEDNCLEMNPRVLAEVLRRAPAVIGTESSVYYMASMLGTPTCMLYPSGTAYAKLAQGDHSWDWFYNLADTRCKAVHFGHVKERAEKIAAWAKERQDARAGVAA